MIRDAIEAAAMASFLAALFHWLPTIAGGLN